MVKKGNKVKVTKNDGFKVVEENAKDAPIGVKDINWEGKELQIESGIKLEDDKGEGNPVVLRFFDFMANPETFSKYIPSAYELFGHHRKGIELSLWNDGLVPEEAVNPRILISKQKNHYRIIVGARYAKGRILKENPLTLSEIAHSTRNPD